MSVHHFQIFFSLSWCAAITSRPFAREMLPEQFIFHALQVTSTLLQSARPFPEVALSSRCLTPC